MKYSCVALFQESLAQLTFDLLPKREEGNSRWKDFITAMAQLKTKPCQMPQKAYSRRHINEDIPNQLHVLIFAQTIVSLTFYTVTLKVITKSWKLR